MIDPTEAQPSDGPLPVPACRADEVKLFFGPQTFTLDQDVSLLGLLTGFKYVGPTTLELRRILVAGGRFSETFQYALKKHGPAVALGCLFYVDGKVAYGYWFTGIELLDQREELSAHSGWAEDVLILSFDKKADISSQLKK